MSTQAKAPAAKPAAQPQKKSGGIGSGIIILVLAVVAHLIFYLWFGNGSHFEGGVNTGHPISGDYYGLVFKGGFIVPILMTCFGKDYLKLKYKTDILFGFTLF